MPISAGCKELPYITKAAEPESIENSDCLQPLSVREKEEFGKVNENVPASHENK